MMQPAVERFLADVHARDPGGSARAFGGQPVQDAQGHNFTSSYHALLAALQAAMPVLPSGPVIDLACGDGHLLAMMKPLRRRLIGVDLSLGELDAARTRLGPDAELLAARAQQLPLPATSMAAVTCHMALQLMNDAARVVAEIARILRPAGRLVALVPRGAGATATPDPVRAAFKDAQRGEPRMARWETVRFGDPALSDVEATRELLLPHFAAVTTTALQATQHLTPAGLWQWFSGMYDRELLPEAAWPRVKRRFEVAIAPHLAADGTAALHHRYLLVDASLAR